MTNKEAVWRIKDHMIVHHLSEPRAILITEALEMAIKALEKEDCDNAISREEALVSIRNLYPDMPRADFTGHRRLEWSIKYSQYIECEKAIKDLRPVNPVPKEDTVTVEVKHQVLTKDDIKDVDSEDDIFKVAGEELKQTIALVKEDQEKFIFNCITPFLAEINEIVIPKEVLVRALTTFKEEHTAECEALMKRYGGTL